MGRSGRMTEDGKARFGWSLIGHPCISCSVRLAANNFRQDRDCQLSRTLVLCMKSLGEETDPLGSLDALSLFSLGQISSSWHSNQTEGCNIFLYVKMSHADCVDK